MPVAGILIRIVVVVLSLCTVERTVCGQATRQTDNADSTGADSKSAGQLQLDQFRPRAMLKVRQTDLQHAKFPVIDAHTHFYYRFKHAPQELDTFVELMNRNRIAVCISLDGKLGPMLAEHQQFLWKKHRDRFAIFAHIDWQGSGRTDDPKTWDCQRDDFVHRTVEALKLAAESGACGLKIFKRFGLRYRNADGSLIRIDDPRWDPIWQTCGELGFPVIMHTADPAAFFLPIDKSNERIEELLRHPDWSFYGDEFPSREELLTARNNLVRKHPGTNFIGAHVANNAEDLQAVSRWLDEMPNLYIGIASRISELGRQPFTAREFLMKYQDRVVFSTDGPWPELRLRYYWRFLETQDEYFPYSEKEFPPQGFWQIYGVNLPDDVLQKIYSENIMRIVPGLREKFSSALAVMPQLSADSGTGSEATTDQKDAKSE